MPSGWYYPWRHSDECRNIIFYALFHIYSCNFLFVILMFFSYDSISNILSHFSFYIYILLFYIQLAFTFLSSLPPLHIMHKPLYVETCKGKISLSSFGVYIGECLTFMNIGVRDTDKHEWEIALKCKIDFQKKTDEGKCVFKHTSFFNLIMTISAVLYNFHEIDGTQKVHSHLYTFNIKSYL